MCACALCVKNLMALLSAMQSITIQSRNYLFWEYYPETTRILSNHREVTLSYLIKAAFAIALVLVAISFSNAQSVHAGVSAPAITLDFTDAGAAPLIQKVHGCHRVPRIGPVTGVRHRHVGPFCTWKKAGNACRRWRNICRERCYDAPRPVRCKRRCFRNNAPPRCF